MQNCIQVSRLLFTNIFYISRLFDAFLSIMCESRVSGWPMSFFFTLDVSVLLVSNFLSLIFFFFIGGEEV